MTAAIASRLQKNQCIAFGVYFIFCDFASKIKNVFLDFFCAVLLTVLFMFVPLVFRIMARWEGTTQWTHVELSIMNRIFIFKLIVRASRVVPQQAPLTRVAERPFSSHTLHFLFCFGFRRRTRHRPDDYRSFRLCLGSHDIFNFLRDVGVTQLHYAHAHSRTQFHHASGAMGNCHWLPSGRAFS